MPEIFSYLSVVASVIAGLLFTLLVTLQNERTYSNRLLSPFVLTFCLALLQGLSLQGEPWTYFKLISASLFFLAGPSLYCYARYVFRQQRLSASDMNHVLPFVVIAVTFLLVMTDPVLFSDFWWLQQRLLYLQLAGYSVAVWLMVKKAQTSALDEYSDYHRTHLIWVSALCLSVIALLGLDTIMGIAVSMLQIDTPIAHHAMMSAIAIIIIGLTFHSLRQPLIMHGSLREKQTAMLSAVAQKKYQKSSLSESQARHYLNKLTQQMAEQKYYLDNELTLTELANQLALSRHHLSQIINENLATTFYDYINTLRVEEAKVLLLNEPLSVTEVCFASGFANKATFNNAFKKLTSQTPSQWRKTKKAA